MHVASQTFSLIFSYLQNHLEPVCNLLHIATADFLTFRVIAVEFQFVVQVG